MGLVPRVRVAVSGERTSRTKRTIEQILPTNRFNRHKIRFKPNENVNDINSKLLKFNYGVILQISLARLRSG